MDYPIARGKTPKNDCVGLIYYALDLLGKYPKKCNIDEIGKMCESVGMVKTYDINRVWQRACVVCFQDDHNVGTEHVNHVYYSLGGKSLDDINKYDLGSEDRIQAKQPFFGVPVNEWEGKMSFLCAYYFESYTPCNDIDLTCGMTGFVTADTNLYEGAGTKWKKIYHIEKNTHCIIYPCIVTSPFENDFRLIQTMDGVKGYIIERAIAFDKRTFFEGVVTGTDGELNVRAGVGVDKPKISSVPEGECVYVNTLVFDSDGTLWANVTTGKNISGFTAACHIKRI